MVSDKERLDTSAEKMRQLKTSWTRELKDFYPDYSIQQIEELKKEIIEDMAKYPVVYEILLRGQNEQSKSTLQNRSNKDIQQNIQGSDDDSQKTT